VALSKGHLPKKVFHHVHAKKSGNDVGEIDLGGIFWFGSRHSEMVSAVRKREVPKGSN